MAAGGKTTLELIIAARDRTKGAFAKVGTQMRGLKTSTGTLNGSLSSLKKGLGSAGASAMKLGTALGPLGLAAAAVAGAVALVSMGKAAVDSFALFESGLADVRKTTGMSKAEIKALGAEIDNMATSIPVAHGELTKIAAIAGQLGIVGESNILGFTENIAKMTVAFDMNADAVATSMAKLANIYDLPIEQASNLGSAINVLGNTTAASESQLMAFSMSLGPTGRQLGFAATETLSLGASMVAIGMDASNAGTRLSRAFSMIGQNLDELAKFMGVSTKEFTQSFEDMPMETFMGVLEKLSQVEGKLQANTVASELFNEIGAKAIKGLTGDLDGLKTNLANSAKGFADNTSLTEEFAAKTDTLQAKFDLFGNVVESFKIKIGAALAPLAGALTTGAMVAINGLGTAFDMLMKVAGPVLDIIFIKAKLLHAFFEGLAGPIIAALSPLKGALDGIETKFSGVSVVMKVFSDIMTILTAGAKWLGNALGTLLAKAITPLVAKIKEAITVLTDFYNKLGPIKDIAESVKGALGKAVDGVASLAESFKEAEPAAEKLAEAIEELEVTAAEVGVEIGETFKTAAEYLAMAAGNYKTAIKEITDEIDKLKDAWNLASEEERAAIEEQIDLHEELRFELIQGEKAQYKYAGTAVKGAKDATDAQKEFKIKIGETTITFKDQAAAVLKNANAYANLEKQAATLLDLNWETFTNLKTALPDIDIGIKSMADAFVGLEVVLSQNIDKLEAVKESVAKISELTAPFTEKGFLNGIESIGNFANALKSAGGAINTFSNLQEVSVDGCTNFSLHVRDMVSALEVLESKMEDLVPDFAKMDSLITDVADSFVYSEGRGKEFQNSISSNVKSAISDLESQGISVEDLLSKYHKYIEEGLTSNAALSESFFALGVTSQEGFYSFYTLLDDIAGTRVGYDMADEFIAAIEAGEDLDAWCDDFLHTSGVLTHQMDVQTGALKDQTEQLAKITDALQPYLEFMRTLNELAALSTLSTEELNNGLNAINDTLMNLGKSLETFDLGPTMESLFGTKIAEGKLAGEFTGGAASGFMDTMIAYQTPLNALITYITRLSDAINGLTSAFDALANISDSVLADQTKLTEVFEGIVDVMSNFSIKMGGTEGFAEKFASGIDAMLKSAAPLIQYFVDNSAAIKQFNSSLLTFKATITTVVDVMKKLKDMASMTVPSIDEIAAGFDRASEYVKALDDALLMHLGIDEEARTIDMAKNYENVFSAIENFAKDWAETIEGMDKSFKTFDTAASTITGIIDNIIALSTAFTEMKNITVILSTDMEVALSKISKELKEMETLLESPTWKEMSANVISFSEKWALVDETVSKAVENFGSFVTVITNIISATTSVSKAVTDMAEVVVVKSKDMEEAFKDIPKVMAEVAKYLGSESFAAIEDGLIKVNAAYETHKKTLEGALPAFESAISKFSSLADGVLGLNETFLTLKDTTVATSREMGEAFYNIRLFTLRFTAALHDNLGDLTTVLIDLDVEWKKHTKEMDALLPSYESSTKGVSTLIGSLLSLTSALTNLAETGTVSEASFDKGFTSLIASIGNFSVSLTTNVDAMIDSLQHLRTAWMENEEVLVPLMVDFVTITRNFTSMAVNANIMAQAFAELSENSGSLEAGFAALIKFIKEVVKETQNFHTPEAAVEMAAFITDVGEVIDAFKALDLSIAETGGKIERSISESVTEVASTISSLKTIISDMYEWGANAICAFAQGVDDYTWVLGNAISGVAATIRQYLGVSSPTELGPLADLEQWPKNLVQSFASGIKNEMGTLNASFSGMVVPIEGSGACGGNHTSILMNITQNISDKKTADYSTRELEKMLNRHEVM